MKSMRSKALLGVGIFLAIVIAGLLAIAASRLYTEYAWYRSLGQENVFTVRIVSKFIVWAAASVFAFIVFYINTRIAEKLVDASRFTSRTIRVLTAVLAGLAGLTLASKWITFRLAAVQSPFGVVDPQFGKDVGFFVFTLPALELLATWANGLIVLAIVCVLAIVLLPARPGVTSGLAGRWWGLKTVMSVLVGLLVLWSGFNYWISLWRLDIATHSQFTGASYTDVHTQIPALTILTVTSVVVALVLFLTARSHKWGLLAASFGAWAVLSVALGTVWPAVVQTYSVAPNEATRELPYIGRNIEMTRAAFDLEEPETVQYSVAETLSPAAAKRAVVPLSTPACGPPTA